MNNNEVYDDTIQKETNDFPLESFECAEEIDFSEGTRNNRPN